MKNWDGNAPLYFREVGKMATTIVTSAYQDLEVTFNEEGWFNATSVAERFGKEVTFWLNQRETVEYIAALASQLGKINSYTVQELNLIKQLESSSAASRAALLAFAKKTGLVHVQHGFMLIQGVGILLAQLGSDLRCHHPALIGY
jgi:hypothetical protein